MEPRIQPLELADAEGRGTGRYRLFAIHPEDAGDRRPVCDCPEGHANCAEAEACDKLMATGGLVQAQPADFPTVVDEEDKA